MKLYFKIWKQYAPWLFLLLFVDSLSVLMLWLADVQAFYALSVAFVLFTVLLFCAILTVAFRREKQRRERFLAFIYQPDEVNEEALLKLAGEAESEMLICLGEALRSGEESRRRLLSRVSDYEEYVEAWAHETKTPLSLLLLLLDNRREELPENIAYKLDYIRNRMQEAVSQMLFFARIKGAKKDYLFEDIKLTECIEDVLEDYRPLLEEKDFLVSVDIAEAFVFTDRRGLLFLISQAVSNAVKYCKADIKPKLCITSKREAQGVVLSVRDNGMGVPSCDLPYIFEKGFTGASGSQRNTATGMGLYLVKEIAGELNITVDALSEWGEGFSLIITFPAVSEQAMKNFPKTY